MAVWVAAKNGDLRGVKAAIENGADIEERGGDPEGTGLHHACNKGRVEIVKYLLDQQANVHAVGKTLRQPLHWAARKGHLAIVCLLIERQANVRSSDEYGSTPLHLASQYGHTSVADSLIQHSAQVNSRNKNGNLPIHFACKDGHLPIVKLLISQGSDFTSTNKYGEAPLQLASKNRHTSVVDYITRHCVEVNNECQEASGNVTPDIAMEVRNFVHHATEEIQATHATHFGLKRDLCSEEITKCLRHNKEACSHEDSVYLSRVKDLENGMFTSHLNISSEKDFSDLHESAWIHRTDRPHLDEATCEDNKPSTSGESIQGQKKELEVGALNPVTYRKLCDELNQHLHGKDYLTLASKMKYGIDDVKKFERSGNATDAMLTHWKTKSKNNVNKLVKFLNKMERHDLVELLEEALLGSSDSSSNEE